MNKEAKEFIKKAYKKVPLYVNLAHEFDINIDMFEHIDSLPLIEKEQVMLNDTIIASDAIPLLYKNELILTRTSGSTGKYLDVYWKKQDYNKSLLPLWLLRKKYYNINPGDKMCFFYTILQLENEQDTCLIDNQLGFSKSKLDMESLKEVYLQMLEFRPKWIMLQPSIGLLLCQCIDKYGLDKIDTLEYIEMSGEILTDEIKSEVEKHFKCKIANQYGTNEVNSIAFECPEGNMHLMESNLIVEIVKDGNVVSDGEEGHIYVTTLTNSVMPLIRYNTGDIGKVIDSDCKCGRKHKILELTSGRANDYILCEDESKMSSYVFVRAIDAVNYRCDVIIKQFKITQTDINEFEVVFVVDEDDLDQGEEIAYMFIHDIRDERLKNAKYSFEYRTHILPQEKNGKYMYFSRKM